MWVPQFTPSRLPLFDQRWTVLPPGVAGMPIVDLGSNIPSGPQEGIRWSHTGARLESSLSFFNGFNHLPDIDVAMPSHQNIRFDPCVSSPSDVRRRRGCSDPLVDVEGRGGIFHVAHLTE